MATEEERYQAAVDYVRRAVATVESRGVSYAMDPITGVIEWYAGVTKTTQPRAELSRVEERWRATRDAGQRAVVAREAELLADRVEESLPGAPQDRSRTNLLRSERPIATPPTSYDSEVGRQVDDLRDQRDDLWRRLSVQASAAGHGAAGLVRWLLIGGGVAVAWKGVGYLRERHAAARFERALNASLERQAAQEDDS